MKTFDITMSRILLEAILLLFISKLFITIGSAYPIDLNNKEIIKDNNIITKNANISTNDTATIPYTCVYIPSNLDPCKFNSYISKNNLGNLKHTLLENKKRELSKNNPYSSMHTSKTDKRVVNTIIYEIQRCVPLRLPFILPECTEEDLSNKKSELYQLYPFVRNNFLKTTS